MKINIIITMVIDTEDYTDVRTIEEAELLGEAMIHGETDFPNNTIVSAKDAS